MPPWMPAFECRFEQPRCCNNAYPRRRVASIDNHAADRFAHMHQVETLIDIAERELMRDEIVDIDLLLHIPIDDFRHVGAAMRPAEGRAFPAAAGDELE